MALNSSSYENFVRQFCKENQNILFILSISLLEDHAIHETMRKNIVEQDRTQMTIWRMCFACWITKATNTHSEYVIVIDFPLQQWLHQRASILRYMYIAACLVCCNDISLLRRLHILAITQNGLKLFCCSSPSGKIVEQSVVREF